MKNIAIILMVFALLGVTANAQKANLGEVAGPLNFSGGAIIAVGVAKTISIQAYKPTVVTSPVITYIEKHLVLLGGVAIIIVIILIIALLLLHRYLSKKITRGA